MLLIINGVEIPNAIIWTIVILISYAFASWYSAASPTMANKAALVVPALKKHTATVIMAHGLGDR